MIRAIIYIGILFCLAGCAPKPLPLQTGDLLFQTTDDSPMTRAICSATGKNKVLNFSHAAIFVKASPTDSVLEASTEGGVRMLSLEKFLLRSAKINGKPCIVAKRLRDTTAVYAAVARAKKWIGCPYDYSFRPDNGKFYCTELIQAAYLDTEGRPRFSARPMNFRASDGTMPRYWVELFEKLGEPIPEGVPGTNPNDLSKEEILKEIYCPF